MTDTLSPRPDTAPARTPGRPRPQARDRRRRLEPPADGGTRAVSGARALRQRLELAGLLLATAVLYLWNLGASGWANAFYSAAAQAGSQDWAAWFFGSSDAANAITVDKPPASLWLMGLSVRIFGLSSWSVLVPQALMGVGTVWLVYLAVRRAAAPATADADLAHRAGLLAGAVMALTPVAVLMFRFNNPDALLVLLMTAAAYAVLRSIQDARVRWLLFAGVLLGFGFLTKQLQVLLVVPGFAVAYLLAAPAAAGRRILHLLGAGAAMAVAAGWWLAAVELIPAADRPYIGGSQNNSIMELTLGYNGLGRLNGDETGSVGGSNGWGTPGLFRLFNTEFGGQIAWLLPSVLLLGAGLLWLGRRAPRTDPVRASVIVWGSWVAATGLTFSFMAGIIHPYYMVALAPGIAGLGGVLLWQRRNQPVAAAVLAVAIVAAGAMAAELLVRTAAYMPWLRWVTLLGALAAAGLVLAAAAPGVKGTGMMASRTVARTTAALAVAAALAGPLAYSLSTEATAHSGSIVSAGPAVSGRGGAGIPPALGGAAGGGFGGATTANGTGTGTGAGTGRGQGAGGMGGLLGASTPSAALVAALQTDAGTYTWAAAVVGSNNAASYQLATQLPVMAVGGFNGTDPAPTLAQFQQYVADGKIHYFIAGRLMQGESGSNDAAQIAAWVQDNFTARTVGGTSVYLLAG